jgi:hypothetical protein
MGIKEFSSMQKHRRLLWSLGLSALVGLMAGEVRAETILMTIDITGHSFDVTAVANSTATTFSVDAVGLAAINGFLSTNGSQSQLTTLGGSSNFPGNASQGNLVLTGEIHSAVGGGSDSFLKITETESDFTSPTGPNGVLMSSSTGNFTNQPAGGGHTASSAFNATSTPTYSVFSSGIPANGEAGGASIGLAPVSTLYMLTNIATFGLAHAGSTNDIVDSFGVTAVVTTVAIPEPASLVTMLMGIPLPLMLYGLVRRRRHTLA